MTMKMINSTSKISIIGVMLIYGDASLVLPPPPIAIAFISFLTNSSSSALLLAWLQLIGHKSDLIEPGVTYVVDNIHNLAVRHSNPTPDVNHFRVTLSESLHSDFDRLDQIFLQNLIAPDVIGSCERD